MAQDNTGGRGGGDSETSGQEHTHPYASVPDGINASVAGQPKPAAREPAAGRPEPAYATASKVQDPRIAQAVFERAMEIPITVTQRELLSLAPEVRAHVVDATVKRRMPREPVAQAMIERIDYDDEAEELTRQQHAAEREERRAAHMPAAFVAAACAAEAAPQSRSPVLRATIEEIEDEDDDEPTRKRKDSHS
jgi:hypothetical protein